MVVSEFDRGFDATLLRYHRYLGATGGARGKVNTEVTVRTYGQQLRPFWRFCARFECTPYEADVAVLERWFEFRRRGERDDLGRLYGKVSSATRVKDLTAIRHFYAMLRRDGVRADDPSADIVVKHEQSVQTRPQPVDELEALLAACYHERDRLMVLALACTGMRIGELEHMDTSDVTWRDGRVKLHGKGNKERFARLPADVLDRLRLFVGMLSPEGEPVRTGPVWRAHHYPYRPLNAKEVRRIIAKIGERAGVEVHPHRLRASFAVNYIRQHHDLQELQRLMGHADANTTIGYLHWLDDEQALENQADLEISRRLVSAAWGSPGAVKPPRRGLFARISALLSGSARQ